MRMPEPIVDRADGTDPEHEALLADSVGLALLVVLETLTPGRAARVRAARHVRRAVRRDRADRRPLARGGAPARQPRPPPRAGRARRRPTPTSTRQREVVDAFLAAARDGDFEALLAVLDPDVVLRADVGAAPAVPREVRGAAAVAGQALVYSRLDLDMRPALVNGAAGAVAIRDGEPFSVGGVHGPRRQDRRDRLPRRPGAPARARPDGPRRLRFAMRLTRQLSLSIYLIAKGFVGMRASSTRRAEAAGRRWARELRPGREAGLP